ncbi:hypothetical protein J2Y86_005702 [Pseudomonas migulae]|nr:hypothetical protein [Pseudomonas migulae]
MLLSGHLLPLSEHPDEEWNDLWLLTESSMKVRSRKSCNTAHAGYRFDLLNMPVFKSLTGYFAKATAPCVIAYGYARIRRLVRLGPGFYRWSVAENQ